MDPNRQNNLGYSRRFVLKTLTGIRHSRTLPTIALILLAFFGPVRPVVAQTDITGRVAGTVKDAQSGVLPGPSVKATNLETG
jgi:hypothetical protein